MIDIRQLRQLRQFIAVAEELHFRRAAARLNMSQPPLTAAINRLEQEIGARLIERGNRVVSLTPAGRTLLDHARQVVAEAERALVATRDAAEGRSGVVRLGYVGSAMYGRLPEVIRRFRRTWPDVRLDLQEATSASQVAALRQGELDLGVLIPPLADGDDLLLADFDHDRLTIALPTGHPLAAQEALALADLASEPFILWPAAEGRGFHLRVIRLCAAAGFVPSVAQEARQMHGVLSLVAVEAGMAIVPASMAGFRSAEVAYRPITQDDAAFDLVLCRRNLTPGPALANFLAVAAAR